MDKAATSSVETGDEVVIVDLDLVLDYFSMDAALAVETGIAMFILVVGSEFVIDLPMKLCLWLTSIDSGVVSVTEVLLLVVILFNFIIIRIFCITLTHDNM